MMQLPFTKMHGLGNDFVVIDATDSPFTLTVKQIRQMADRHFGVGFDQLLVLENPRNKEADFFFRVFNADGSEATQCGNGARCLAKYLADLEKINGNKIILEIHAGKLIIQIKTDGNIDVNMGRPIVEPASIPMLVEKAELSYLLKINNGNYRISVIGFGNPHAVMIVEDVDQVKVEQLGLLVNQHPYFPQQVNVGFMQIVDHERIRLRVYERGVGETLACGSAACAAAVTGIRQGLLGTSVRVELPGGELEVRWTDNDGPVWMSGPAKTVFVGEYLL